MPDVPSAKEAGAADYQLNIWNAIYAPKGTPKEALAKLNDALNKTLDDPETAKKLGNLGATVPKKDQRGPEFLRKSLAEDIPRWAPILKEAAVRDEVKPAYPTSARPRASGDPGRYLILDSRCAGMSGASYRTVKA